MAGLHLRLSTTIFVSGFTHQFDVNLHLSDANPRKGDAEMRLII
jgi:hypothetical protein